jgi:uncharacterized protein YndB with AHSA1/START domain
VAVQQHEVVEREVRIAARPETVFEFFTDPDKHLLWMGRRAELDPRPGGIYDVEINDRSHGRGEFVGSSLPAAWSSRSAGSGRRLEVAASTPYRRGRAASG